MITKIVTENKLESISYDGMVVVNSAYNLAGYPAQMGVPQASPRDTGPDLGKYGATVKDADGKDRPVEDEDILFNPTAGL